MALKIKNSDFDHPGQKPSILLVDDTSHLNPLRQAFGDCYEILHAVDTAHARELLKNLREPESLQLILTQPNLPGDQSAHHSLQLFQDAKTVTPNALRMLISSPNELETLGRLFTEGSIDQYLTEPVTSDEARRIIKRELEIHQQRQKDAALIKELELRNKQLLCSNESLGRAVNNLQLFKVGPGVFWLQVPEADLRILCGCPADVVKHLKQTQYIAETDKGETGPNAILLSDSLIQQGEFSNLAEFPILQMLYLQGMIVPNHPGNIGVKPILMGREDQVRAQLEYIFRGNYGLCSVEEIMATGIDEQEAKSMMRMKLAFAFGAIKQSDDLLDACIVPDGRAWVEIRNGVSTRRHAHNHYEFQYKGRTVDVNLNLAPTEQYSSPYQLGFHSIEREFFGVLHVGEGDGWDTKRPAMSSILLHQGNIFLIDAGPNLFNILLSVGIDISEIKGIFHTHCHDDHFAGLPALMQADHRIRYYSTPLVRAAVRKKLSALMSIPESEFTHYFDVFDLECDQWNDIDGLEVKPVFSPHPVENTIFTFRAVGGKGYRTYGHWADLTSYKVLDAMITDDETKPGVTRAWAAEIKEKYQTHLNLKKIDIGGGLIHGVAEDYIDDKSDKIVLAHTPRDLTTDEKKVGANAAFASVDVLIGKKEDYLRHMAMKCLVAYFPEVSTAHLSAFLNCDRESYNPGETILERGKTPSALFLLIAGSMEKIEDGSSHHISTGSFIGEESLFESGPSKATFRSISHIELFRFSHEICRIFLESTGIANLITALQQPISALKRSWLFDEGISTLVKNRIARLMVLNELAAGKTKKFAASNGLYLVAQGIVTVTKQGDTSATVYTDGHYFGEQNLMAKEPKQLTVTAEQMSQVYFIPSEALEDIPLVHWRMLEKRGLH